MSGPRQLKVFKPKVFFGLGAFQFHGYCFWTGLYESYVVNGEWLS